MRAEEFLQKYRVLEETLGEKYLSAPRHHASVVMEYLNDAESEPYREKLDLIREMRNLLSHNADVRGGLVFEPSQGVLDTLDEILRYVRQPPLAMRFATPAEKIVRASPRDRVLPLMKVMERRGFSHIPVLDRGEFLGVFSARSVFSKMAREPGFDIRNDTTLEAFADLLPLEAHRGERYSFLPEDATLPEVRHAFLQYSEPNARLAVLFLTATGDERSPLSGMITPWDALGQKQAPEEST